jgi:NADPH:quinone reductase-like Zn-dependent oxidoreductase
MFTGSYGVAEDGTYSEWIAVRAEDLCVVPDTIDDATAGGMPVAYLTAQIALTQAGFEPGKIVLASAIGGAVGNAVTQLARAQGAAKAISTTTNPAKAEKARALGFGDVIDLSAESLTDGVARLTGGRGVDVVIDSVGGGLTGQALATLALDGVLTSLGYSAGRKTTIDVTDLIWRRASMRGFSLFAQSHATKAAAWAAILPLLTSGRVKPVVERAYKLDEAAEALRHLIEDRPFGRVVLAG